MEKNQTNQKSLKKQKRLENYLVWVGEKYLSYRPRTGYELRNYLRQKLIKKEIREVDEQEEYLKKTIDELASRDEIKSDKEFTRWWVDERSYFKPRGKRALQQELRQKGVSSETITSFFEEEPLDETGLLEKILVKKNIDFNDQQKKQKFIAYLLRRGFSYGDIKNAIDQFVKKK